MKQLVRLGMRPSRDGKRFVYRLDYVDGNGKRRRISLGHADKRKAERQTPGSNPLAPIYLSAAFDHRSHWWTIGGKCLLERGWSKKRKRLAAQADAPLEWVDKALPHPPRIRPRLGGE